MTVNSFAELGLNEPILKALSELGLSVPTPIQSNAIPALLGADVDILAVSNTGTGKTAAFGLPLVQKLDPANKAIQALVLCPTRELAQQTAIQLRHYSKHIKDLYAIAVYGGTDVDKQIRELEQYPAQIIVATPGRLMDLLHQRAIDLYDVSFFILDEADEMLRMGFKEDIDHIRSKIDHSYNTWMFCATTGDKIESIKERYLSKKHISIEGDPAIALNPDIIHQYMVCKPDQKREGLKYFIRSHEEKNGIVFCRTKAAVDEISAYLVKNGFSAASIHSDLTQKERDAVLRKLKMNEIRILVATDIAARGLDIKGLGFVVHYHLPEQREYFNHRSGRTGRAGNKGISLLIVFQKEVKKVNAIANNLGLKFTRVPFDVEALPAPDELNSGSSDLPELKAGDTDDMVSFYINMGKVDEVNRKNLVDFLCHETGIKPSDISNIIIEKKRSYFDVKQPAIRALVVGLKGMVVDGKNLVLTRKEFDNS